MREVAEAALEGAALAGVGRVEAKEAELSCRRFYRGGEGPEERGLAGAVRAEEAEDAAPEAQVHVLEHLGAPEVLGNPNDLNIYLHIGSFLLLVAYRARATRATVATR